ncbi:TPA: M3 family metallopeptidase [Klebsiella michiganensis]|nr:M3 family metallopeptidase [Klebsiella michiganensis]
MELKNNPLLGSLYKPAFSFILPEHISPEIKELVRLAREAVGKVTAPEFPASWINISNLLDVATERLSMSWSVVCHLNAVADNVRLREAINATLPEVTTFWSQLGVNKVLYEKYCQIEMEGLNDEQKRALELRLKSFIHSGVELSGEESQRFIQIQSRLAKLNQKFSENVLDATDVWSYIATNEEVKGLPNDILQATAITDEFGSTNYKLSLKMPVVKSVLRFAHSRELRERLYMANSVRASDLAPRKQSHQDNSVIIDVILSLRAEKARLLGFANYAELSLASKMANSPEEVMQFLNELSSRARSTAEQEVRELRTFAQKHFGLKDPMAWDWDYLSEQLRQNRYSFSEQELKSYFTADHVLTGLFSLAERLFNIRVQLEDADVWHPTTRCFRIERESLLLGHFFLDPLARDGKRGGAWMAGITSRWDRPDNGFLQTPVSYLVCNFANGVEGKPALMTHREVITLFHEFGHGLQHLLTQVGELSISGINGVEWDAIELPSQLMENFCWEWPVLQEITSHTDTGESIPLHLYEKIVAARNFQSGIETLRQVELAIVDMKLHMEDKASVLNIIDTTNREVSVIPPPPANRMTHVFTHIFSGAYAAGYYSYKWAEVLSADAYAAFEEEATEPGKADQLTGERFMKEILVMGGSRPAMDSFMAFRGRKPQLDALFHNYGMNIYT